MRNILFSYYDWGQDPAASVVGGFSASQPGANLLDLRPQLIGDLISGAFTLDLGATRAIGLVHLQNLVNVSGVSVSFGGYSATQFAPPAGYDALEYAALGQPLIFIPPVPVLAGTISVTVTGGFPLGIGYVGACEIWEPKNNLSLGWRTSYLDESDVQRVPFGSTYITKRGKRRRLSVGLGALFDDSPYIGGSDAEVAMARKIMAINGMSSPIMIVPQPDAVGSIEREAVWGLLSAAPEITNPLFSLFDATFQIDQLI